MRQLPASEKNLKRYCEACPQGMASREENLAYVAEHDPAGALQEYRRRMAARPQQTLHAPVAQAKQERQSIEVGKLPTSCPSVLCVCETFAQPCHCAG